MNLLSAFLHLPFLLAQADTPDATPALSPDATPDSSPAFSSDMTINGQHLTPDQQAKIMGGIAAFGLIFFIIFAIVMLIVLIGMGKTFAKAGKPGWACIVPIYNAIVLCEIAGKPAWWFLILGLFVPWIIVCIDIAKRFGKGTGFGLGLAFISPIFFPILGFGSARYLGAGATPAGYPPATV